MNDGIEILVETFMRLWLAETELGRSMLESTGLDTEQAIDSAFELMNSGFLKLEVDADKCPVAIAVCIPPEPLSTPIKRPSRQ